MSFRTPSSDSSEFSRASLDDAMAAVVRAHRLGDVHTPQEGWGSFDADLWPEEWREIEYKEYGRLGPDFPLAATDRSNAMLANVLAERKSATHFSDRELDMQAIATALKVAASEREHDGERRRPYPSAGARYPTEIYLLCSAIDGLATGVHHYNPNRNALTLLFERGDLADCAKAVHGQDVGHPSAYIVLTTCLRRSAIKYAARGYRFALLEAGACAFALDLVLTAMTVQVRWIGGFDDAKLGNLLGISRDQELEFPVLMLAVGHDARVE